MLPVGSLFGDYRIVRELGRGGMGVVYLGENVRDGARVAVKVLYPEIERQDREYVLRFIREAEIAMAISHPNLISVYDVGRDPETRLGYMIMEYVAGGSVADRLASDGVFSVRQALQIVMAVASALGEASRHGVVHRDIKPDNILFSEDGTVRLSDLGIAKQEGGTVQTTLTASQMIIGTPAYMAPEQLLDSHAVDVRADIYSLGVSFWEMLAEGEVGLEAKILPAVNAARLLDPDFTAYDWDGRDRDGNRALNGSSLDDYRRGLTYFLLERFRRKNGRLPTEPELQEQAKALGAVPK